MRVLKFGGKSLSSIESIDRIASQVANQIKSESEPEKKKALVVVSAMGQTTSELLDLANEVKPLSSNEQANRELDMLLASGERVSAALFSLALQKHAIPSKSFTGSQAGVLTSGKHSNAIIDSVTPFRIDQALSEGITPVVAGFQGVDPITKDVTTLGRGGSDLTAAAFAHHYSCPLELYKSVGGVFSCDPSLFDSPKPIKYLDHAFMQSISTWGAKILHDKAAAFVLKNKTPVHFLSDQTFEVVTSVSSDFSNEVSAITCLDHVIALKVKGQKIPRAVDQLRRHFSELPFEILASAYNEEDSRFLISVDEKHKKVFTNEPEFEVLDENLVAVSLVFNSNQSSKLFSKIVSDLEDFEIKRLLETPKRLSCFVDRSKKKELISLLHKNI